MMLPCHYWQHADNDALNMNCSHNGDRDWLLNSRRFSRAYLPLKLIEGYVKHRQLGELGPAERQCAWKVMKTMLCSIRESCVHFKQSSRIAVIEKTYLRKTTPDLYYRILHELAMAVTPQALRPGLMLRYIILIWFQPKQAAAAM